VKMFGQPVNVSRKKKGKKQKQHEQQQKTFTPGVADKAYAPPRVVTDTPADQLAVKVRSPFSIPSLQQLLPFLQTYHGTDCHRKCEDHGGSAKSREND
jgi:hypothetical protein